MSQTKQKTGIILCGGKSSRMGKNKALLKINNKYVISYVIDILQPFCDEIILSTNTSDLDFLGYKTVPDKFENIGPIAGILSSLLESKNNKNIILSCDTPFINGLLINELFSYLHTHDVVLPELNGFLQPMTGVFKKDIIPTISTEIQNGNNIPPRIFEKCNLKKLKVESLARYYHEHLFFNINSPADFEKAKEIMNKIKE